MLLHSDLPSSGIDICTPSSLQVPHKRHVLCVTYQHESAQGAGDTSDAPSLALTGRAHTYQACKNVGHGWAQ